MGSSFNGDDPFHVSTPSVDEESHIVGREHRLLRRLDLLGCHECRHVAQAEAAGSLGSFLTVYLHTIAEVGYEDSPFEEAVDSRSVLWGCEI